MKHLCKAVSLLILLAQLVACGATPAPEAGQPTVPPATPPEATPSPFPTATVAPPTDTPVPPSSTPTAEPSPTLLQTESAPSAKPPTGVSITIVYDNTIYDGPNVPEGLAAEWGFAAWIEYGDQIILFDTGPSGSDLLNNIEKLGLDPQDIDIIVLSHIHQDHTGGLSALLGTGVQPVVYVPRAFPESFKSSVRAHTELVEVLDPLEIFPGLHTTGQLGGDPAEQALVAATSEGTVVITGCAHPGILRIVRQARHQVPGEVALVLGGFHLMGTSPEMVDNIVATVRELGVRQVSPTHCTGEEPITTFAGEYGQDYLEGGVGRVFAIGEALPPVGGASSVKDSGSTAASAIPPDPRCDFGDGLWDLDAVLADAGSGASDWQHATPEEQGLDSHLLEACIEEVAESSGLYSTLIIRYDHIVLEEYFAGATESDSRDLFSASESILSVLLGIAIDQGYIETEHQRLSDILPEYFVAEENWPKKAINLQDLLTQSSRLMWEDDRLAQQVAEGADWVEALLDTDYISMPGYHYSTHSAHLLSAAISGAGGASTCEFAYHYLFDPLGITVEHWGQDPEGISIGGWNLFLTPRELAKIGLLVLHDGQWQDQQIVPADWVAESLSPQMDFGDSYDYGYLWWLREIAGYQIYSSLGPGGQSLHLIPELEMVIVTTGDVMRTAAGSLGFAGQVYLPLVPDVHGGIFFSDKVYDPIRQCIIPALVSDG